MNNRSPITIIVAAPALAVVRIVLKHPALLQRQACITDMLWHIGIGQRPFQVTATLGYDNVDERFIQLAGESRSLLPDLRQAFQAYNLWTEGERPVLGIPEAGTAAFCWLLHRRLLPGPPTRPRGATCRPSAAPFSFAAAARHSVSSLPLCLSVGGDGDATGALAFANPSDAEIRSL